MVVSTPFIERFGDVTRKVPKLTLAIPEVFFASSTSRTYPLIGSPSMLILASSINELSLSLVTEAETRFSISSPSPHVDWFTEYKRNVAVYP